MSGYYSKRRCSKSSNNLRKLKIPKYRPDKMPEEILHICKSKNNKPKILESVCNGEYFEPSIAYTAVMRMESQNNEEDNSDFIILLEYFENVRKKQEQHNRYWGHLISLLENGHSIDRIKNDLEDLESQHKLSKNH